ncbi:hypothetical protein [Krasilnikovia cinnamomea]|uniref:hypothetical protein n=1 Tax=Krasilnikovia cinnamomea TaxID=349313 RepID=UPI00102CE22E|nr:hypothetical protein [Krasilnikovia cinnamomea]
MPADSPTAHPAATAVADAFAGWVDAVLSTRAEIRDEITAEGGDPDGPDVDARLREVMAAARDGLSGPGRVAFDWIVTGMRDTSTPPIRSRDPARPPRPGRRRGRRRRQGTAQRRLRRP